MFDMGENKDMDQKEIWIFAEYEDGHPEASYYELLSAGRDIAAKLKQRLCAVVIGRAAEDALKQPELLGAERIYSVGLTGMTSYEPEDVGNAICSLAKANGPDIVLFPASDLGRCAASRLAVFMKTGLTADCSGISVLPEGTVVWQCPSAESGFVNIVCRERRPQMATILPGRFPKAEPRTIKPQVVASEVFIDKACIQSMQALPTDSRENLLTKADIVIGGGIGMKTRENFQLLERAARAVGGALGATRAAVYEGWAEYDRMIGQSGCRIAPKVYIACGISGYAQHMIGVSDDTTVIAVNNDPNAPIFRYAKYGIVGDAAEIISSWLLRLEG